METPALDFQRLPEVAGIASFLSQSSVPPALCATDPTAEPESKNWAPYPLSVHHPLVVWAVLVLVIVGLLVGPAPPLVAFGAGPVEPAPDFLRSEAFALLNSERQAAGLSALDEAPDLDGVALSRALDMASAMYFAHVGPGGISAEYLLHTTGVPFNRMGENIARSNEPSPLVVHTVHEALMASPGHRANMLAPDFRQVGIGIVRAEDTYYFAVVFVDAE